MFFRKKSIKKLQNEPVSQAVIVSFDTIVETLKATQGIVSDATDRLDEPLELAGAAYDGDEYGDDECNLYFYGPSAEKIYDIILPELKKMSIRPIRFTLRFGDVHDKSAKEEQRRIV
ncbi:MAG: hypothetical protein ACQR33_04450 [Candidatus Saccharibacteria bacterium]